MRTAWKLLVAATVVLTAQGCCSWCGSGCNSCPMTAPPAYSSAPAATQNTSATVDSRPILPSTATLAIDNSSPPLAMWR